MHILRNYETSYPNGGLYGHQPVVEYAELDDDLQILRRFTLPFDESRKMSGWLGSYVNLHGYAIGKMARSPHGANAEASDQHWLFVDSPVCRLDDVDLVMSQRYVDDMTGHFTAEHEGLLILDADYPRFHGDEWHTEEEWDLFYQLAHHRR